LRITAEPLLLLRRSVHAGAGQGFVELGTARRSVDGMVKESVDDIIDKGERLESYLLEARKESYREMKKEMTFLTRK
jgi:hypothetical protein